MANFDKAQQNKRDSVQRASVLLDRVRSVYSACKSVQAVMALYQAATDAPFNAAVNTLFTASERAELGQILTQINALVTDWEANHQNAIGGP